MDIQPDKQNLNQTFSATIYCIDFYQRDYRWNDEPVRRLLDDVFYQFDEAYQKYHHLEAKQENINANYPWYYLNTYVTNTVQGSVYVVDGQRRLTTLTLILMKMHSLAKSYSSKTLGWLSAKITGYSGTEHQFWMNHTRHRQVLEGLFSGDETDGIDVSTGVTAKNMVENYKLISEVLDNKLKNMKHFDTFVHYFLYRLVLINLSVEHRHVPMVFEVINDRGVRLKPFEILKGKLLGQIDKLELESEKYNELWDKQVAAVNVFREDEIDNFFRYYLRSKYSDTRANVQRFDGEYHREMFKDEMNGILKLDHNPVNVKQFLKNEYSYFSSLYTKIWNASISMEKQTRSVFYNNLNELDTQFMLIMSACKVNDQQEDVKIESVAAGLNRMFSLLQLQGAYDSNEFASRLFELNAAIREKDAAQIPSIINQHLIAELAERRGTTQSSAFNYAYFKPISIDRLNTRFIRYLFARIELFLSEGMKQEMKHSLRDLVTLRGAVNGFHIEHILSHNDDNMQQYDNDEERFDAERNRLGGVLLLKGKDNISSSNEKYKEKLATYATTLLWNETLRPDTYKSKLDFKKFARTSGLVFQPMAKFGPEELEERHKLIYEICQQIWPSPAEQN